MLICFPSTHVVTILHGSVFHSGRGANGGNPGIGGNGGNGASGGRVVIHTNDPSLLVLLEVNAAAGDGGKPGEHGKPGHGGTGGEGGKGGAKATWSERQGNGDNVYYKTCAGKEGREGKKGKNGKAGKNAPSRPSKAGRGGETGSVSFCLYDDSGLSESSGTPYRIVLTKNQLSKLRPVSRVEDVICNRQEDKFIYGQEILYGPALPENIGGLECPMFFINGTIHLNHTTPHSNTIKLPYPPIPAGTDTRNGTLPSTAAQQIALRIPTLAESKYECTGVSAWPWPQSNGKTPEAQARFNVAFEVGGILMRQSEYDGNNSCGKDYTVDVDIPIGFVSKNEKVVTAPVSLSMSDTNDVDIGFTIMNKLSIPVEKMSAYRCGVHVTALKFRPTLRPALEVGTYEVLSPEAVPEEQGFLRRTITQEVLSLKKEEQVDYNLKLKLPPQDAQNTVIPGARIHLRGEILCEDKVVTYTVPTSIRVAPPLPSVPAATEDDLLIFTYADMHVDDFLAIEKVCKLLAFRVHYIDTDHFLNEKTNAVNTDLWASLKGKATVLWAPGNANQISRVPLQDLLTHAQAGAPIISGDASVFGVNASNFKYATAGRKCIKADSAVQLLGLKFGLVVDDTKIAGNKVMPFLTALLGSMSAERKLKFLLNDPTHGSRTVGTLMLDSYQTFATSGCCGCGGDSKVSPVIQKPLTLHDLVLTSIRHDLSLDIQMHATCGLQDQSPAYKGVLAFATANVLHKSPSPKVAQLAADVCAVLNASGITDKKCPVRRAELALMANQCQTVASAGQKDPMGLVERVKDCDVIQGLSRRKKGMMFGGKDPIDLTGGVSLHVYRADSIKQQWF